MKNATYRNPLYGDSIEEAGARGLVKQRSKCVSDAHELDAIGIEIGIDSALLRQTSVARVASKPNGYGSLLDSEFRVRQARGVSDVRRLNTALNVVGDEKPQTRATT